MTTNITTTTTKTTTTEATTGTKKINVRGSYEVRPVSFTYDGVFNAIFQQAFARCRLKKNTTEAPEAWEALYQHLKKVHRVKCVQTARQGALEAFYAKYPEVAKIRKKDNRQVIRFYQIKPSAKKNPEAYKEFLQAKKMTGEDRILKENDSLTNGYGEDVFNEVYVYLLSQVRLQLFNAGYTKNVVDDICKNGVYDGKVFTVGSDKIYSWCYEGVKTWAKKYIELHGAKVVTKDDEGNTKVSYVYSNACLSIESTLNNNSDGDEVSFDIEDFNADVELSMKKAKVWKVFSAFCSELTPEQRRTLLLYLTQYKNTPNIMQYIANTEEVTEDAIVRRMRRIREKAKNYFAEVDEF